MRKVLLAALAVLGIYGIVDCAHADDIFTIFLARHAEKDTLVDQPDDPPLSDCGESRAVFLAKLLADVELEHVYSTPYERTRRTANPVADSHQLDIELYDPHRLEEFSDRLLEQGGNVLVVGHSNTTAVLAGLLAGQAGEEFDEDEYDRLYLVTVSGGQRQLILLQQAFRCYQ